MREFCAISVLSSEPSIHLMFDRPQPPNPQRFASAGRIIRELRLIEAYRPAALVP